jgi:hypothetical protein
VRILAGGAGEPQSFASPGQGGAEPGGILPDLSGPADRGAGPLPLPGA